MPYQQIEKGLKGLRQAQSETPCSVISAHFTNTKDNTGVTHGAQGAKSESCGLSRQFQEYLQFLKKLRSNENT